VALAFTGVHLLACTSLMPGPWSRTLVMCTDHKETRSTEHRTQHFVALPVPTCYSARFRFLLGSRWVPSHGVAL
jgi:hypothetical protein